MWQTPVYGGRVMPVHAERLVESGAGATLESTDAWIDANTGGVRLIARASLPLKIVRSLPGGAKVFAGRDERTDGKRFVQFVVKRSGEDGGLVGNPMTATLADGTNTILQACGFARASVPVADGGGTATFQLAVRLPALGPGEKLPPSPFGALPPGSTSKEVRARTMRVHVAVSQSSRDKEPLVSIAPGWVSREQMQRVTADGRPEFGFGFGF
jgi:hypothetical protein